MKRLIKKLTLAGCLLATLNLAWAGADHLLLENLRIAVGIDQQSGAIRSIRDKDLNAVYPQTGIGCEVVTKKGTLLSEKATAASAKAGQVELLFVGSGLDVTLHYRLGANDHFVEK